MLTLIYGASASGKSEYAEKYICKEAKDGRKYYIATMIREGGDMSRITKHVKRREGLDFITLEKPYDVGDIIEKDGYNGQGAYVLLECLSDLLANEMFAKQNYKTVAGIIEDIDRIEKSCAHLIVVSDDVFADGTLYDESVIRYMRDLADLNRVLATKADRVYEVAAGIPIEVKV